MDPEVHRIYEQTYQRGSIIEDISVIEEMMNAFISHHYFTNQNKLFIEEILESEHCSFQMKKSLVLTLLKKNYSTFEIGKLSNALTHIQSIRNIIAHAVRRIEVTTNTENKRAMSEAFFQYRGTRHFLTSLEKDFITYENQALEVLEILPGVKGYLIKDRGFKEISMIFTYKGQREGSVEQLIQKTLPIQGQSYPLPPREQ